MAINKVEYGNTTLIDLTPTTATAADVASGKVFFGRDGVQTTGTASSTQTITLSGSGNSTYTYVQLNSTGTKYYADGDTINFSYGDTLYVRCAGRSSGGIISVNSEVVAEATTGYAYYVYTLPEFFDVAVALNYGIGTVSIVVTPTISITQNGTHDVSGYAYANVNVSGGGGASNFVQGTFTTQSSAGVQSISVPYTGSGYPVSIMVYVAGGAYNSANSAWYNSTQRYAVGQWTCSKSVQTSAPTYATSGTQNQGVTTAIYKNSTSSSTSYTRTSGMNTNVYSSSNATNAAVTCVRYHSGNVLSVYVNTSSYGLLPGIEYQYQIVYSS